MSSDEDDDKQFRSDSAWHEVKGRASKNSDKNSNTKVDYLPSCQRATVAPRSPPTPTQRKPTARKASNTLMHHASNVFQIAAEEIFRRSLAEVDTACADSGATDHMIPDYSAFISYRPSLDSDDNVILGDDTTARIAGRGTAVISLNGKRILLRNALHVPTMKNPLYSLTHHYL